MNNTEKNRAIESAKDHTEDDELVAVDDGAIVEVGDRGYWVQARVFISDERLRTHIPWENRVWREP